jgi:hypothetical protein
MVFSPFSPGGSRVQILGFSHPRLPLFSCGLASQPGVPARARARAGSPPLQSPPSYLSRSPLRPSSGAASQLLPPAAPVTARYGPFSPTVPHTCPHLCSELRASPAFFASVAAPPFRARGVPLALHFGADFVCTGVRTRVHGLGGGCSNHYTNQPCHQPHRGARRQMPADRTNFHSHKKTDPAIG